ncbi:hypothetical protein QZH41_020294 [Actinostola sp. cb2023]|nr:hypothetical protein QZH41_020294 [Actinostola sp. cb2023]
MSTDLFTPRSHSMATRDFGSTFSCSSSEASSRLAARLERSEYKRSRAKQRMNGSSRSHSRRKDSRGNRKKNSVPSTRETRTKSEEDGVTSVWEVYRQNPYYYSDAIPQGSTEKREQRNTWYGVPSSSQPSQRRPQSIHIGSSDYGSLEYQSWLSRKRNKRIHMNKI